MAAKHGIDVTGAMSTYTAQVNSPPPVDFIQLFSKLLAPVGAMLFAAGMLYFNFETISIVVKDHEDRIKQAEVQAANLKSDQRLFSASLEAMSETQKQLAEEVKKIGKNIDNLTLDMALIKEKVGTHR